MSHKIVNQPEPTWVPKGWGGEKWIDNREEYCCKILNFVRGKKLSIHYHKQKTETFYCLSGKLKIKFHDSVYDVERYCEERGPEHVEGFLETIILGPDETFFVPPGRVHQMIALVDTKLIEVSTEHFDEDSYRIVKGD
jgi:mannose-6-phosphate isomerase-like protein (cupin superfamily)